MFAGSRKNNSAKAILADTAWAATRPRWLV